MGRKEGKISKEQAGFRTGYSTIDHIFTFIAMVKRTLNSRRGGKVYVAFIDYKNAFDTVDREKLWETREKLKNLVQNGKYVKVHVLIGAGMCKMGR